MKLKRICDDTRGASIVEFTVTVPFFMVLTFGLVQAGLLLWTQLGLQHGVERAARCASVNYSAKVAGQTASCFSVAPSAVTAVTIEQYAQANSYGLNLPYTNFSATTSNNSAFCGSTNPGYLVTASYTFNLINYIFSVPLTARSCYPITVS